MRIPILYILCEAKNTKHWSLQHLLSNIMFRNFFMQMLEENKSNWIISVKSSHPLIKRRKTLLMPISYEWLIQQYMLLQGLIGHHFSYIFLRLWRRTLPDDSQPARDAIHCLDETTNKSIHESACFKHDPCNTLIEN